jgi:thiosulfate dehydrogenase (quinone) large subunit
MTSERENGTVGSRVRAILEGPGGTLLLLRGFLGVTFTFAGLQKLANPDFFKSSAPASFAAQVRGAILTSPLHGALRPALHAPVLVAIVLAFGELAVGLGTFVGLFGRVAATGGILLSLSFFLTVSFHDSPYYYGADIVFLFAWTPFLLGGSGEFSLDAVLARFGTSAAASGGTTIDRRTALRQASAAGGLGAFAVVLGAADNRLGSHFSKPSTSAIATPSATTTTTTTTAPVGASTPSTTGASATTSPPAGEEIGLASAIAVGDALAFTDQQRGIPAYCVHKSGDEFVAFSAICTHAGCTVGFDQSATEFVCPCHGSIYNALTGAVIKGPAPLPLPSIGVQLASNGTLYATD